MTQKERDLDMIHRGELEGKKDMAISMLKDNLDLAFISKYTGLSVEDIKDLQKSILVK